MCSWTTPVLPIAAAVVEMVAVDPVSLNRATDTSPLASGLASTSRPPAEETSVPCLPRESWSTAITALLVRMDRVAELALTRLLPSISGAAISAHRLNSDWSSVALIPLPISSMSGSFHAPGPAKEASPTLVWKLFSMLREVGLDVGGGAPQVRHRASPGPRLDAGIPPVAHAEHDRAAGRGQRVAHPGVQGLRDLLVRLAGEAAERDVAPVVLEVVDAPGGEQVRVLLLVPVTAGVPGAGRRARVLVDAELEAERVHVAGDRGDAVGELGRDWRPGSRWRPGWRTSSSRRC